MKMSELPPRPNCPALPYSGGRIEQTGFAAQRERVMAAVPDQHGRNVIVMVQERIRAVRVVRQLMYVIE